MSLNRNWFSVLACWPVLLASGCGGGSGGSSSVTAAGFQVSGSVLVNGQPAPAGQVLFEAVNTGPSATAEIQDGKYSTPPENGVYNGPHRVVIEVRDAAGKSMLSKPYEEVAEFPSQNSTRDFDIKK